MTKDPKLTRTSWAEVQLEEFLSISFVREFVFRSPQLIDTTQKELADMLITHSDLGILIQQKCQENPDKTTPEKELSWVRKKAKEGFGQLKGALRTGKRLPFWCVHSRRGRVEFPSGLPRINHGVVLVETFQPVNLKTDESALPLEYEGIPISYFSLSDFMNIALNLRSLPELVEYMTARRVLPTDDLRSIGSERQLFEVYLLNDGKFPDDITLAKAGVFLENQQDKLLLHLMAHSNLIQSSKVMEYVADQLAVRHKDYADGLSKLTLSFYDNDEARTNYLVLQEALADLRLSWRGALGRSFQGTIDKIKDGEQGLVYGVDFIDPIPEWIFVFGKSQNEDRVELLEKRMPNLTFGAMAFFGKKKCLTIIDRDGESFEVQYFSSPEPPQNEQVFELGKQLFGHLRIESVQLNTLR